MSEMNEAKAREKVSEFENNMFKVHRFSWWEATGYLGGLSDGRKELDEVRRDRDEFQSMNEHHKEMFLKANAECVGLKEQNRIMREALRLDPCKCSPPNDLTCERCVALVQCRHEEEKEEEKEK